MARIARVVVPDVPHHVIQRGNRRERTFFMESDYLLYMKLMAESCAENGVCIWCYCLMPNHVHLIAVPEEGGDLARAIGLAHLRYTRIINERQGWRGFLWQGRFSSFPMDDRHTLAAARYIESNPLEAGMVTLAEDYRWSSARAHLEREDDQLVQVGPLLSMRPDWREFLRSYVTNEERERLELHERTGRPLGDEVFIARMEKKTGRSFALGRPGRKPKY
jgi:putative transposase